MQHDYWEKNWVSLKSQSKPLVEVKDKLVKELSSNTLEALNTLKPI
jgi:hypothetical protein